MQTFEYILRYRFGCLYSHSFSPSMQQGIKYSCLHSKFSKDFEDLDLQIVTDKGSFRNYLRVLTYAEEYYFISRKLKKIHDSIGSARR